MPNFLIIGAAKSGTTSLYHYLRQHPDVFMSPVKEPNYYSDDDNLLPTAIRSRANYEKLFAGAKGERARGEATVRYLNAITGVERIYADLPDVRLIVS
ncbi:MAG TPA: sulfotransferase, partial [Thermoanaerobaculia bacterium]|nr:sulfotransferase [Thermoanaerobaculia bacterium]